MVLRAESNNIRKSFIFSLFSLVVFVKKSKPRPIVRSSQTPSSLSNGIEANHVSNGHGVVATAREPSGRGSGSHVVSGAVLKWQQFCGLVLKRFFQTGRNLKGLFSQIVLPSFFITVAMVFALSVPTPKNAPPLALNTAMFDRPNYVPFANEANYSDTLSVGMETTLKLPSGIGSFCYVRNKEFAGGSYSTSPCKTKMATRREQIKQFFNPECVDAAYRNSDVHLCENETIFEQSHHKINFGKHGTDCYCSHDNLDYICPVDLSRPAPKEIIPATLDTLRNVSGRDVSKYLLYTTEQTRLAR